MKNSAKKQLKINIGALLFAALLLGVYLMGMTYAWFTDTELEGNTGTIADVDVTLVNDAGAPIASPISITYASAQTVAVPINIKNDPANSTISAYIRIIITAYWIEDVTGNYLPISSAGIPTFTYQTEAGWTHDDLGVGYGYSYYNTVVAVNSTANFLDSITFADIATIAPEYTNAVLTFQISAEGIQGNVGGVYKWDSDFVVPAAWPPLSLLN